jgi:muconolactone delta-isomerase
MKILAIEHENKNATPAQFARYAHAEAARAWELHQRGFLRELYFRADREEAVLVLECDDVEMAESLLATLPLVEQGLITFEIIPLRPYPGFARLFDASSTVATSEESEQPS